jgi:hypothetical protein
MICIYNYIYIHMFIKELPWLHDKARCRTEKTGYLGLHPTW